MQYIVKRLIGLVIVVISVTFLTFMIGYYAPGDPIANLLGQHYSHAAYITLKHAYGLDLPWYQQYYKFSTGLLRLDFGYSFAYKGRAVWDILREGAPISIELGLWALLLQVVVGVPLGIFSATKANTWIDTSTMTIMLIFYAIPSFILAITAQIAIVWLDQHVGLGWPAANWGNPWQYTWSDIQFKSLPILVYAIHGFAHFARITRTAMLEVLHQDYIRTAQAKGMRKHVILYRHAFRNSLIPLITLLGPSFGSLVAGAFFIERIFNIPGIAEITLTSIDSRDYPVIQATTVILAVAVVLGNLLSDALYTIVDPRIQV